MDALWPSLRPLACPERARRGLSGSELSTPLLDEVRDDREDVAKSQSREDRSADPRNHGAILATLIVDCKGEVFE